MSFLQHPTGIYLTHAVMIHAVFLSRTSHLYCIHLVYCIHVSLGSQVYACCITARHHMHTICSTSRLHGLRLQDSICACQDTCILLFRPFLHTCSACCTCSADSTCTTHAIHCICAIWLYIPFHAYTSIVPHPFVKYQIIGPFFTSSLPFRITRLGCCLSLHSGLRSISCSPFAHPLSAFPYLSVISMYRTFSFQTSIKQPLLHIIPCAISYASSFRTPAYMCSSVYGTWIFSCTYPSICCPQQRQ